MQIMGIRPPIVGVPTRCQRQDTGEKLEGETTK